ncbi:MAG: HAMP domain-containing sensor histidine kinase [Clostridiales bacterium]|nr:HAMP domain-containing sensor histidine kinase [Clostridiales bacterium]
MKKSLYTYFIWGYLVFGVLCCAIVFLCSSFLTYEHCLKYKAAELYEQATSLAESYSELYGEKGYPDNLQDHMSMLAAYTGQRIWFINGEGRICYDSADSNNLTDTIVESFDITDSHQYYRTGDFYGSMTSDVLSVLAPVTGNFQTYGYIVIHIPLSEVESLADQMMPSIYYTVLLVYFVSLLILLLVHVYVILPLSKITQAANEYAAGNLKYTVQVDSQDEFGYLADTLNLMTQELSYAEENQKKFIANVSHDFRSPLTSIKGYLEAMIDGVIPPENQEKYIRIVIAETERLNNLTQSMLSLNSLERKNMHLEYSNFDICPLIKNVCATFEGKCFSRNITIDLRLSSASIPVHADMGRIQQVIYNLTDNAIKFSNNNSSIRIQVTEKREKVFVAVKDYGIGIPKENLKKIWNRFFKTDESRGKDKYGTGLGLSIVKEIIQAHGENIDVISTEGIGTEFIFSLTKANSDNEAGIPRTFFRG